MIDSSVMRRTTLSARLSVHHAQSAAKQPFWLARTARLRAAATQAFTFATALFAAMLTKVKDMPRADSVSHTGSGDKCGC